MTQQCLTPPLSDTIIATLCAEAAREKRLARRVAVLQALLALFAAVVAYSLDDARQYALAILAGGWVSAINGALLAWRMSGPDMPFSQAGHALDLAQRQLRLMYAHAAERFMAVAVLLGLCMVALKLPPLAVLGGFAAGQVALLSARLFLSRSPKSWTENSE